MKPPRNEEALKSPINGNSNDMTIIKYNNTQAVLLIDTSFYVFHRYFATLKWWEIRITATDPTARLDYSALHTDEEFIAAFKKHVAADLKKLQKRWSVPLQNVMFCIDTPRADIWRNLIYQQYKEGRVHNSKFNGGIFPIFYKHLNDLAVHQLSGSNLEADDVVYLTSQRLVTEKSVIVISNDNDYLQMRSDKVEIHNLEPAAKSNLAKRSTGNPREDLLIKILRGDSSDNITQVCGKMGEKTAAKLAKLNDTELLQWASNKSAECLLNFKRNQLLISFEHIPQSLSSAFNAKYTFVGVTPPVFHKYT